MASPQRARETTGDDASPTPTNAPEPTNECNRGDAAQIPDASEPDLKKRKVAEATMSVDSPSRKVNEHLVWDTNRCGDLILLSNKKQTMETCILDSDQWNCVLASQPASRFRVRLDKLGRGGELWIGYCKKDRFVPNGSTRGRFCQILRADDGVTGDDTSHPFCDGDELTITHHRANHTIVFQKNGQDIGIEYEHVTDEARYPAIVTNSDQVFMTLL
ncbi:hypothetical protein H310_07450 [Aphanomyces invadans]|uniref:SPRY domain-containing protein n=1 Tax=Aphanomyces invadans TaxID=157072 RepID=A0A024U335_9STRA|nr:hypothetical protein H310_07450 [Aphanomyces invadans]ETW00008.1 hypothetical protein H310_07450 [Aphanomyces invadans]RHY26180.1 hypothetical protein DYB32_007834 [Aphanomyces invadans]|eukprot:XP_008871033.1 hypothetical protein H310_07450 [Aphanomyces invadans]